VYCDCFREESGHDRFRRHGIARSVTVSAFGGKMSTDGHLGSGEAFRNHFDDRGWCVDSGVVCLAVMETTASCSHRMRCGRAGRVPDVPWAGATACPSSAIARTLLPNSPLHEMNALLARQFIRRQCHATSMVDPVAVRIATSPVSKRSSGATTTPIRKALGRSRQRRPHPDSPECPTNKSTPSSAETPRRCSASTAHSCKRRRVFHARRGHWGGHRVNRNRLRC
jgi:hypothetical protein